MTYLLPLLLSLPSFNYGVGILRSNNSPIVSISNSAELSKPFFHKLELGGYIDSEAGRKHAMFTSYQLGLRVNTLTGFYAESSHGIGYISSTDILLGGRSQFFHDLGLGIVDDYAHIGMYVKHISSAGIHKPNIGRNYIYIKLGLNL